MDHASNGRRRSPRSSSKRIRQVPKRRRSFFAWWWRQRLVLAMITAILSVLILAVTYMPRKRPVRSSALKARLELAAGAVRVEQSGDNAAAFSGIALLPGARVHTDAGARAMVRLPNGSSIFMGDSSLVSLGEESVELEKGRIWLEAPSEERKAVALNVGETRVFADDAGLSIERNGKRTTVYVARGLASVAVTGGRVEARAGELVRIKGGTPEVIPVAFWDDWTGGMADSGGGASLISGTGQLYGVDAKGAEHGAARVLEVARQAVRIRIRSGMAETEVDQSFLNPTERDLEGWYWFTLPSDANVTGFAVETNGVLLEGTFRERKAAALHYGHAVATGQSPAILEWINNRTYRARIHPVPANGVRRVVLRYLQLLPVHDGTFRYVYPLRSERPTRIGEFSLCAELGLAGTEMDITTLADARVEDGGRKVTMRRSGYTPRADFVLEAQMREPPPTIRKARFSQGGDQADYVMLRYTPDFDWTTHKDRKGAVVVAVDTSAAGDDSTRLTRVAAAEAILRALSEGDQFALVAIDVRPKVLHPKVGLASATDDQIRKAMEALAEHAKGGATDLESLFGVALERLHGVEQAAAIYVGDGIATSGEMHSERLVRLLGKRLATSRARLFTVGVGPHARHGLLAALSRSGGGQAFHVLGNAGVSECALNLVAALKTPTLTDFSIDLGAGLDQAYISANGKVVSGEEVVVLARSHHRLPQKAKVRGRLGGREIVKEYWISEDDDSVSALVPRFWAAERIRHLLGSADDIRSQRSKIMRLGLRYKLMTPFTSILAVRNGSTPQRVLQQMKPEVERRTAPAPRAVAKRKVWLPGNGAASEKRQAPAADAAAQFKTAKEVKMQEPEDAMKGGNKQFGSHGFYAATPPTWTKNDAIVRLRLPGSDAAQRPLHERIVLWQRRINLARGHADLIALYMDARSRDELHGWNAEAAFLRTLVGAIRDANSAQAILAYFAPARDTQRYLAGLILRRSVDPQMIAAVRRVLFGERVDWLALDRDLLGIYDIAARIARVREALCRSPDDPEGVIRLTHLLVESGRIDEALLQVRQLRDSGLTTPHLARKLGDLLAVEADKLKGEAARKVRDEAVRTYSEIVEFDPRSLPSRQLLGDIYLARGWYEPAYRQYRILTSEDPENALSWLRLARAASGSGRVDEALRIERQVTSARARPGPNDPRQFAKLWSAVRLARMLCEPGKLKGVAGMDATRLRRSIEARLRGLQLLRGPASLVLVTWEDLSLDLEISLLKDGNAMAAGKVTDASRIGLSALLIPSKDMKNVDIDVKVRGDAPAQAVKFKCQVISWDGSAFKARVLDGCEIPKAGDQTIVRSTWLAIGRSVHRKGI